MCISNNNNNTSMYWSLIKCHFSVLNSQLFILFKYVLRGNFKYMRTTKILVYYFPKKKKT